MKLPVLVLVVTALASCSPLYFDFYTPGHSSSTSSTGTGDAGSAGGAGSGGSSGGSGGALCTPGAEQPCYDGLAGTEGQGICKAGAQTCAADGMSWGPCMGEVLPQPENCATPEDEDCDGTAQACTGTGLWAKRFGDVGAQSANAVANHQGGAVITGALASSAGSLSREAA